MALDAAGDEARFAARSAPWLWLGLSIAWAAFIVVTDQVAWPLAVWIATTVGPLTALELRRAQERPDEIAGTEVIYEGEAR